MPAPALSLAPLRAQLDSVIVGGRALSSPWPSGLRSLDRALGGGIPRGRITQLIGPLAVGKTALLRQVVARALQTGAWVAWIDARRTLTAAPWADLGERFVVIRPPDPRRSAWTADLLLRSGVFGLVVIDGAPPLSRVHGVRLAQLARERDAACVVLEHLAPGEPGNTRLAGTLRVRLALTTPPSMMPRGGRRRVHQKALPVETPPVETPHAVPAHDTRPDTSDAHASDAHAPRRRHPTLSVRVEKAAGGTGGPDQIGRPADRQPSSVEVDRVVVVARRVCTDSEIPDRRGVARSARRPWTARGNSTDTAGHDAVGHDADVQRSEHPVTWGGLGVGGHDLYGIDVPGHPARLAAGLDDAPDRLDERHTRELDRLTRDWTTYRGRRRAAESGYGRRSRRELARERTGALLASHSGQSRGSNGSPRLGRDTRDGERDRNHNRDRDPAALG